MQRILYLLPVLFVAFISSVNAQTSCNYQLVLQDAFGDGWNGASLLVTINGNPHTFTLDEVNDDGTSAMFDLSIEDGDEIVILFSPGTFDGEITYLLLDPTGQVLFDDGPNPFIGVSFEAVLSCDCFGLNPGTVRLHNLRDTRLDVSWTTAVDSNVYVMLVDTTGFDPEAGTGLVYTTVQDEYRLTGLIPNTSYEIYIASVCPNGDTASLIGPYAFTTLHSIDVGIASISTPTDACDLGSMEIITVGITNYGGQPQTFIPFNYSINGVPANVSMPNDGFYTGVIGTDSIRMIEFDTRGDFSAPGKYVIQVWTEQEGDADIFNDTLEVTVINIPIVRSLPYYENFEGSFSTWSPDPDGVNSSWEIGVPQGAIINMAASPDHAAVTNLTGVYNNSELSYLDGPCFDFSTLAEDPYLTFSLLVETENGFDDFWVEVSRDGGMSYNKLGAVGEGLNWYTEPNDQTWTGANLFAGYTYARHKLDDVAGEPQVKIRFVFRSDGSVSREGVAIDNILVSNLPEYDLAILSTFRTGNVICGDAEDTIGMDVVNLGTAAVDSFRITYQLSGGQLVTETIRQTIAPGETYTVFFNVPLNTVALTNVLVRSEVELLHGSSNGDDFAPNDRSSLLVNTLYAAPFAEDFEDGFPTNWQTTVGVPVTLPGGHNNTTAVFSANLYSSNPSVSLTTTPYGLVEAEDSLTFEYRYVDYSAPHPGTMVTDVDTLSVLVSTDCGENYELLYQMTGDQHSPTEAFTMVRLSLADYVGQRIQLMFVGVTAGVLDYYLDLDNINLKRCGSTINLETTNIDASEAGIADGAALAMATGDFGPYQYAWNTGDTTAVLLDVSPGAYVLTVTDRLGCQETAVVQVDVTTSVQDPAAVVRDLTLAPNPTRGLTTTSLELFASASARLAVYDLLGRPVFIGTPQRGASVQWTLDLQDVAPGVYLIRVLVGEVVVVRKVMVSR